MSQDRTADAWNQHYISGNLPWDSGRADTCLLETIAQLNLQKARALEIGCGTGVNALAMALNPRSFASVAAIDIAPRAIELAQARAAAAGVRGIDFRAHDIIASAPIPHNSADFVFDRGVFHSVAAEHRPIFAQRVADALATPGNGTTAGAGSDAKGDSGGGAWWLSLCGNADDKTPGGPPRMTLTQIAQVVEPLFVIHEARQNRFRDVKSQNSDVYMCWKVLMRKR